MEKKIQQKNKEDVINKVLPYIRDLIGERSIRQASEDMGIAASYLSGILRGKYLPSANILRKMADESALPQGGITLEDLMVAAGYQQDYALNMASKALEVDDLKEDSRFSFSSQASINTCRNDHYERIKMAEKYRKIAKGICLSEIAQKNIMFNLVQDTMERISGYKPNIALNILEQPISEWWLYFYLLKEDYRMTELEFRNIFWRLVILPPQKERKVSYVINNPKVFERLSEYKGNLSYRGDLSIILVDTEEMCVLKEEYLTHYCEDSIDSELYII